MNAILIDPYLRTISMAEVTGCKNHLPSIYQLLHCSTFECPVEYPNLDTLYCDEEAWLTVGDVYNTLAGFAFPGWSYPILGRGLIIGTDSVGESRSCLSKPTDFLNIIWCDNNTMNDVGHRMGIL